MRQQSRTFFTAGLSINCACLLKQPCIAPSLCASESAANAKEKTRFIVEARFSRVDSLGDGGGVLARIFGNPGGKPCYDLHCGSGGGPPRGLFSRPPPLKAGGG